MKTGSLIFALVSSLASLAPRLKMAGMKGRSVMAHTGGDNHADTLPHWAEAVLAWPAA